MANENNDIIEIPVLSGIEPQSRMERRFLIYVRDREISRRVFEAWCFYEDDLPRAPRVTYFTDYFQTPQCRS